MPYYCKECQTECVWLKQEPTIKNPNPKPNPIEVKPNLNGNLVISRDLGLYRFATKNEREQAMKEGKNLYISHYAKCSFAQSFRGKTK